MMNTKFVTRACGLITLLIVTLLTISACRQKPPKTADVPPDAPVKNQPLYLKAILANNIQATTIVVVPREGCGGCISDACGFLVRNQTKFRPDVSIVFTGVEDQKLLKKQVGNKFINDAHVKIDLDNYFLAPVIASSYPMLIVLKNNGTELKSISQLNTADFKQLKYILKSSI